MFREVLCRAAGSAGVSTVPTPASSVASAFCLHRRPFFSFFSPSLVPSLPFPTIPPSLPCVCLTHVLCGRSGGGVTSAPLPVPPQDELSEVAFLGTWGCLLLPAVVRMSAGKMVPAHPPPPPGAGLLPHSPDPDGHLQGQPACSHPPAVCSALCGWTGTGPGSWWGGCDTQV